jgi:hypothetical protein
LEFGERDDGEGIVDREVRMVGDAFSFPNFLVLTSLPVLGPCITSKDFTTLATIYGLFSRVDGVKVLVNAYVSTCLIQGLHLNVDLISATQQVASSPLFALNKGICRAHSRSSSRKAQERDNGRARRCGHQAAISNPQVDVSTAQSTVDGQSSIDKISGLAA